MTTPSWPTLVIASPTSSPISSSREERWRPARCRSCRMTGVAEASSASDTASAALPMPEPSAIGLAPAATLRSPALMIACASTVAVVVPSPATSLVLVATDLTSWAPRFSNGSSRSISRAMVTPSLVTVGPPNALASTTCRPRGPERHAYRVGELVDAGFHRPARSLVELNLLAHRVVSVLANACRPGNHPLKRGDLRGGTRVAYLLTTASTSRADRIRYSSPLYLISVPPYLL